MKKLIDGSRPTCHESSASPAISALARRRVATETGMHTIMLFTTDLMKIFEINSNHRTARDHS